ncbi:MAG: GNAT family N-acetyltransferase [Rhodovibrionaceae bacterium]
MADIVLRDAQAGDIALLVRLLKEAYVFYGDSNTPSATELDTRLRRYLGAAPGFEAVIAETGAGEALGVAVFAPVFWTSDCEIALFLKELFILDRARRKGIGRKLMARLAKTAVQRGWTRVVWTVDDHNDPAQQFYRQLPGVRPLSKTVYMQAGRSLERFAREA